MLFFTANCKHFWRTVPILTLDETDPNKGPDTKLEDHMYDSVAYGIRSRPYVMTKDDRWEEEWGAIARKALGKNVDPYATTYERGKEQWGRMLCCRSDRKSVV